MKLFLILTLILMVSCNKKSSSSDADTTELEGTWNLPACAVVDGTDQMVTQTYTENTMEFTGTLYTTNDGTCLEVNKFAVLSFSGTFTLGDEQTTPGPTGDGGGKIVKPIIITLDSFNLAASPDVAVSFGCTGDVPDVDEDPIDVGGEDSVCPGFAEMNGSNAYFIYQLEDDVFTLNTAEIQAGYPDECTFNPVNMPSSEECLPYLLMPDQASDNHTIQLNQE